jgi:hypothetical protein
VLQKNIMKTAFNLVLIFCLMCNLSIAQQGKGQKPAVNPYEANVKTLTSTFLAVMEGKQALTKLTGRTPPQPAYGWFEYESPALTYPGGLKTALSMWVKWEGTTGKKSWTWEATLLKYPKGTQTEKLKQELSLASQAMAKLYPKAERKVKMDNISAYESFDLAGADISFYSSYGHAHDEPAYLTMSMRFMQPLHQSKSEMADSLRNLLLRQVNATASVADKMKLMKNWSRMLRTVGFDDAGILAEGSNLLQKFAAIDIKLAFAMLMDWPQAEEMKPMLATLSSSQQLAIRQMSQETLDAYYNSSSRIPGQPEQKKIVPEQKQIKEETDPCKIEVAALEFRPGHWIYGQGRSAMVFNYNCGVHLYTIAWMNSKGRLEFESDVSKESLRSRYRRAEGHEANKFILCRDCAGKGYGYGYDRASSYIGSLRIEYNTGDLVRQSCGWCGGKGCMKVN